MSRENIIEASRHLRTAGSLVVLTGAGVSKESGIPTFRESMEGAWAHYDPHQLATPAAFQANPKLVWDWYAFRREQIRHVQPNSGHYAIADFEDLLPHVTVITQNIDGLHQIAGSSDVVALHGDINRYKCSANCQGDPTLLDLEMIGWNRRVGPPLCPYCNAWVRPDVVWFTEHLPLDALDHAITSSNQADVMLVVGTSGLMQPAASFPYRAKRWNSAYIIEVNPVKSDITPLADLFIEGTAGQILPELIMTIRGVL